MSPQTELRLPALAMRQGDRTLYAMTADGKQLREFATVSRIRRNDEAEVEGYQRPESMAHIRSIQKYLETEGSMLPNALVIAFDSRVRFEETEASAARNGTKHGELVIPLDPGEPEWEHPGWIVDGQQRSAALRDAAVASFPVFITAFITDDEAEQRSQFILVNATKPLPRNLIYELLPTTAGRLPMTLESRRFPAKLLDRLNWDLDSPLIQMIATPTTPDGVIKDNSILRMLEHSLTDGALYRWRDPNTGEGDAEEMLRFLKSYWRAVSEVFPEAWGLPPRRSRLMHGVGIVAMGFVMDAIGDRLWQTTQPSAAEFASELEPLAEVCRWTGGTWEFDDETTRRWNELQNTQRDTRLLTGFLLAEHRNRVWRIKSRGASAQEQFGPVHSPGS